MSAPSMISASLRALGLARVAGLVRIHLLLAALVHHAGDVRHPDVLHPHAEADQEVETGERRGAGARNDELHLRDVLADDAQAVGHRGADDDRGAVLVVVEHRDLHPLAALALDVEALGRLDVLEVDAAERRLERDDHVDQLVGVALVELEVEDVDAGELLEQHALAFHHRLAGERTDRAEPEDRGAVRDHRDEVGARGERRGLGRVADDLLARRGDARRIGEREVPLVEQALGRGDRDLPGLRQPVIVERCFADFLVHGGSPFSWGAVAIIFVPVPAPPIIARMEARLRPARGIIGRGRQLAAAPRVEPEKGSGNRHAQHRAHPRRRGGRGLRHAAGRRPARRGGQSRPRAAHARGVVADRPAGAGAVERADDRRPVAAGRAPRRDHSPLLPDGHPPQAERCAARRAAQGRRRPARPRLHRERGTGRGADRRDHGAGRPGGAGAARVRPGALRGLVGRLSGIGALGGPRSFRSPATAGGPAAAAGTAG